MSPSAVSDACASHRECVLEGLVNIGIHGSGEIAQLVKCLLSKDEDPSSIPSSHINIQEWWRALAIPELGRQRQGGCWSVLSNQPSPTREFQFQWETLSQKNRQAENQCGQLTYGLHKCSHTHMQDHIQVHTHIRIWISTWGATDIVRR